VSDGENDVEGRDDFDGADDGLVVGSVEIDGLAEGKDDIDGAVEGKDEHPIPKILDSSLKFVAPPPSCMIWLSYSTL